MMTVLSFWLMLVALIAATLVYMWPTTHWRQLPTVATILLCMLVVFLLALP